MSLGYLCLVMVYQYAAKVIEVHVVLLCDLVCAF